ncbi:hypothetical protein IT575_12075 [bacterium]|nr:hypothetical protein [bacterium]
MAIKPEEGPSAPVLIKSKPARDLPLLGKVYAYSGSGTRHYAARLKALGCSGRTLRHRSPAEPACTTSTFAWVIPVSRVDGNPLLRAKLDLILAEANNKPLRAQIELKLAIALLERDMSAAAHLQAELKKYEAAEAAKKKSD